MEDILGVTERTQREIDTMLKKSVQDLFTPAFWITRQELSDAYGRCKRTQPNLPYGYSEAKTDSGTIIADKDTFERMYHRIHSGDMSVLVTDHLQPNFDHLNMTCVNGHKQFVGDKKFYFGRCQAPKCNSFIKSNVAQHGEITEEIPF